MLGFALLLMIGLAGLGWLVWSGAGRLGEGSLRSGSYPVRGLVRCWRCGGEQTPAASAPRVQCPRCRCAILRSGEVTVHELASSWLNHPKVQDHSYRQIEARTTDGGFFRIVVPGNVSLRPGDRLRFVCCGEGHLRAVENVSSATGWKLPPRALGERSRLAGAVGIVAISAGAPLFLMVAIGLAVLGSVLFLVSLAGLFSTGNWGGGEAGVELGSARSSLVQLVFLLGAALLIGAGVAGYRGRPKINQNFLG